MQAFAVRWMIFSQPRSCCVLVSLPSPQNFRMRAREMRRDAISLQEAQQWMPSNSIFLSNILCILSFQNARATILNLF